MPEEEGEVAGQKVHLHVAMGWVVTTQEVEGPFVIGPFDDKESMYLWRANMEGSDSFAEEMTFHGETMIFYPDSYSEISFVMKEAKDKHDGSD